MLSTIITAIIGGFAVSLATAYLLSEKTARRMPGGSLATGAMIGALSGSLAQFFIGALCGVVGWGLHMYFLSKKQQGRERTSRSR